MFKNFTTELSKLDFILEQNGHFTKTDIFNLNFSKFFKNFMIFLFKRSSEFSYYYIYKNQKYESIYDIEKCDRNLAEIYFKRVD